MIMTETEKRTRQDKHRYFQQIAGKRLERILEALDALGNCSAPVTYAYSSEELPPIFAAIMKKLDEVRQKLVTHSPYGSVPFRLRPSELIELDGHSINRQQLAAMAEVMSLIELEGANFVSLEPVRERYEARFGDELCWNCPIFHDGHSGCILLPVQEGILYLPYNEVCSETYEQFDLQGMGLLTKTMAQALLQSLWATYTQLFGLLSDVQAFGLAQDNPAVEESHG
jgi:hypothetical protein